MRKVNFLFLLGFLLSLGVVDLCFAQQTSRFGPEVKRWKIDTESGQFRPVDKDFPHRGFQRSKAYGLPISRSEERILKPGEANTISGIIKDDFLVNDDTTGGCSQSCPAIAVDTSGNFMICWQDERNGEDGDIYAQRYSSAGQRLGANFRVNDDSGSSWQWKPSTSINALGDFITCWKDMRRGSWTIYAQRYDSSGDPQRENFKIKVDNDNIFRHQWNSSVSMDASGNFVICWEDNYCWDDSTGNDIYAQRYSTLGEPLGGNFRVDDDVGNWPETEPCMAKSRNGSFVICFMDERTVWANDRDI